MNEYVKFWSRFGLGHFFKYGHWTCWREVAGTTDYHLDHYFWTMRCTKCGRVKRVMW